jgi:hypothetical protein
LILGCWLYFDLFKIISAARTPGIQPNRVRINTIKIEPQPLSYTANGGNKMDNTTRQTLIRKYFLLNYRTKIPIKNCLKSSEIREEKSI